MSAFSLVDPGNLQLELFKEIFHLSFLIVKAFSRNLSFKAFYLSRKSITQSFFLIPSFSGNQDFRAFHRH
jgi:hypothetical protein